eukprot:3792-Heterococcus_DN1.PRE.3
MHYTSYKLDDMMTAASTALSSSSTMALHRSGAQRSCGGHGEFRQYAWTQSIATFVRHRGSLKRAQNKRSSIRGNICVNYSVALRHTAACIAVCRPAH